MGNAAHKTSERRSAGNLRLPLELSLRVNSIADPLTFDFVTENISNQGLFISGNRDFYPFQAGTMLNIVLQLEQGNEIQFIGKVMHSRRRQGFGIKIAQMEGNEQTAYDNFLKRKRGERAKLKLV